jgi:hypothetical protein
MEGRNWVRGIIFSIICMFAFTSKCNAEVYNWSGEKNVGNWNGQETYDDGWSTWSTEKPTDKSLYVKATVYLPVSSWSNEGCSTGTKSVITTTESSYVRKEEGSYNTYKKYDTYTTSYCGGSWSRSGSSNRDGCSCNLNTNDPTEYCRNSGSGSCVGHSKLCGEDKDYTIQCYWYTCPQKVDQTVNGSCGSGSGNVCETTRHYCYYSSSSFLSETDKSNWRASLGKAGGYAKKVYVYSYPLRVYIDYDGNGATSICGSGDISSWDSSDTNTYNSNTNILYKDGNPVCTTEFKTGSMSLASNSNETTYIELGSTGNLKENEYYRVGYDFVGWNTKEDGSGNSFKDKEEINASTFNSGGKLYGYRAGETITLYAQWKKHDYKITYSYYCGIITKKDNNDIVYTYNYQEKTILPDLDVSSCENGENTKFLGWYEDTDYTTKAEEIPSSYYKDLTVYAKLKQARYFNYKDNKWEYTSAE